MRKIHRRHGHHAVHGRQRHHQERQHQVQGRGAQHPGSRRASPAERRGDLDDLPGALRGAQSQPHPGHAAEGGAHHPRGHHRQGGPRACRQGTGRRAPARSRAGHGRLPPPDFRRATAARGDRHGVAVESVPAAPGRAHHGPGRHGRGRHHQAHRRHRQAVRHLASLHLPQPRPHSRGLRSGFRHVLRRSGGRRHHQIAVYLAEASLHPRSVRMHTAAHRRQERGAVEAHSWPITASPRAAHRLQLRPALRFLRGRAL